MPSSDDIARVLRKHRHGATVAGKTHFPAAWTDEDIQRAVESTIREPDRERTLRSGDKIRLERIVGGELVRVLIRTDGPNRFWTAYPPNGPMMDP